ncbi:TMEM175 family protein [Sphingomonas mesophila]|uniref:TMEM175 family protein n=1 Tax=Sphingomonas mesophila TaxID=2303576 RepID=UPI000E57F932|nr:TMEM175 family protein [Sphingomonas mesophila]
MADPRDEVRDDPDAPARRDDHEGEGATRGTARMEAFADAVFAIAFTLPVVEIHLPEASKPGGLLGTELVELWPSYLGYALASTVIGLYWVHHHFSGAIYRTTGHWFLIATAVFLAAIGFIAFPARVVAEHLTDPAAREGAAQYWVLALAAVSLTWLLKWTVGWRRGQVDSRLEPSYIARLNRGYWALGIANLAAAGLVFADWRLGLGLSTAALMALIIPPHTPRYRTEAPIVEGES